jgi:hypothetical protein
MKVSPVWAELFHAEDWQTDRQTDMTKLIVDFRNFANVPENPLRILQITKSICWFWSPYKTTGHMNRKCGQHTEFSNLTTGLTCILYSALNIYVNESSPTPSLICYEMSNIQ